MTVELNLQDDDSGSSPTDRYYPDVYFTPGYGTAAAVPERGVWQIARWRDDFIVPYVVRPLGDDVRDAVSPYGYSGVYARTGRPADELARFWSLATDQWREQGLVTLFLRFSPLDLASVARVEELPALRLTQLPDTVTVDVGRGARAVWAGMEGRSRTAVRKARNAGQEASIRPATAEDVAADSPFRTLYAATMARLGGAPGYLFPDEYYRRLADGLGKDLVIAEVHDRAGTVVASALVLRHQQRAHYHLAGYDLRGARDGANNLLLWTMLEWAAETGCAVVHLGGGPRPDDNLFRFKRSFGGTRTQYWIGAVVLDPDRYATLVTARARELGRSVENIRASGFFPAYRVGRTSP